MICHVGARSAHVTKELKTLGYDRAVNLEGGMDAWIREIAQGRVTSAASASDAAAFERHAPAQLETVLQRERFERAGRNRIRDVFDLAAHAAAKVGVLRSRRLVGRRVGTRQVQLGDQTEFFA